MRRALWLLEPVIAGLAFLVWILAFAGPIATYVPMRSDMGTTNPYPVLIAAAFAIAIGISRVAPIYAIGVVGAALVTQLLGWASRFSIDAWPAYGMLMVLVVFLAVNARGLARRVAFFAAVPVAVVVGALVSVPMFSLSGERGLTNGKPVESPEVWIEFAIATIAPLLVAVVAWNGATRLAARVRAPRGKALDALSQRERDVYLWVARGMTNREIADTAHIEESTVKSHVGSILAKLELTSRTAIVAHAYRHGVIAPVASELRDAHA